MYVLGKSVPVAASSAASPLDAMANESASPNAGSESRY